MPYNALKCHLCPSHVVHPKSPKQSNTFTPSPLPYRLRCPTFLVPPYPAALSHKKRGRPAWDALINSELFSPVSVPGAEPCPEQTHCKQC